MQWLPWRPKVDHLVIGQQVHLSHLGDDQGEWELWHKTEIVLAEVQNLCAATVTHPGDKEFCLRKFEVSNFKRYSRSDRCELGRKDQHLNLVDTWKRGVLLERVWGRCSPDQALAIPKALALSAQQVQREVCFPQGWYVSAACSGT